MIKLYESRNLEIKAPSQGYNIPDSTIETIKKRALALDDLCNPDVRERLSDAESAGGNYFPEPKYMTEKADFDKLVKKAQKHAGAQNVLVIGNGGSINPARALYDFVVAESGQGSQMHFMESTDPSSYILRSIDADMIRPENTIIYPVSKSGKTINVITETVYLANRGFDNIVPITSYNKELRGDKKASPMQQFIDVGGFSCEEHSPIGGRFTSGQLSCLLPVLTAAIPNNKSDDVGRFYEALFESYKNNFSPKISADKNAAKSLSVSFFEAEAAGMKTIFMPTYNERLNGYSLLATQLMHETAGKNGKGQKLLAMRGPECQHHTNQIVQGGPKDTVQIVTTVSGYKHDEKFDPGKYSGIMVDGHALLELSGMRFSDMINTEAKGVVGASVDNGIPTYEIRLKNESPESFAELVALTEAVSMYSAFVRQSNWEDQPDVEKPKNIAREMMFR